MALRDENIVNPLASLGEDVSVPEMMSHNYRFSNNKIKGLFLEILNQIFNTTRL